MYYYSFLPDACKYTFTLEPHVTPTDLYKEYLYFYTINDQSMFLISWAKKYIKMWFSQ